MPPFNDISETDRILIALTSLALNAPSTYTIAWSKDDPQKQKHYPILYAGIGTSIATVIGAILGKRWHGDKIMWAGLLATMGLFGYVAFVYAPQGKQQTQPLIIGNNEPVIVEPILVV